MKTRKLTARIIAGLLTLAIVLTGVSFDATTAEAKVVTYEKYREGYENFADLENTTVKMKIGDVKSIDFMKELADGQTTDFTNKYAWSSSNENVVSMMRWWEEIPMTDVLRMNCFEIKAEKAGTAVITGTDTKGDTISFTVVVEKQKITAKMKKCKKHAWKTTKTATCLESGMKTCSKCHLQKTVARKSHEFETITEKTYDYTYALVYQCGQCLCEDPSVHFNDEFLCENWCEEEFDMRDYGSAEAALAACNEHKSHCKGRCSTTTNYREVPVGKTLTYKDIEVCESCGYSKEGIDMLFEVNTPNARIFNVP